VLCTTNDLDTPGFLLTDIDGPKPRAEWGGVAVTPGKPTYEQVSESHSNGFVKYSNWSSAGFHSPTFGFVRALSESEMRAARNVAKVQVALETTTREFLREAGDKIRCELAEELDFKTRWVNVIPDCYEQATHVAKNSWP